VRDALIRIRPDLAVPALLATTILAFACGSSAVPAVHDVGVHLRWVALLAFAGAAVALAWTTEGRRLPPRAVTVPTAALLALAVLSAGWSVRPELTLARAASFAILLAGSFSVAAAASADRAVARRTLLAVVAGAVAVALAGLAVLALSRGYAVQNAETTSAARYRGLGENPNTVPMLYALALPAAVSLLLAAAGRARALAAAVVLLLAGSIFASGSRGAALAALVGVLVLALAARRGRARIALVGVVLAAFVAGFALAEIPSPKQSVAVPVPAVGESAFPPVDTLATLDVGPNLVGQPRPGETPAVTRRSLLGSSGRVQAWQGALDQALERPLLGYGFGTEERVFLDRYYIFLGARPENSLLGLLLQVGAVGLLAFVALGAGALVAVARAWRSGAAEAIGPFAGTIAAGAVLTLVQSYVYSVGNVATVTLWTSLAVGAAVAAAEARRG